MASAALDNIFAALLFKLLSLHFLPFFCLKTALELQKAEFYGTFRAWYGLANGYKWNRIISFSRATVTKQSDKNEMFS